jgi:hypothetical protein
MKIKTSAAGGGLGAGLGAGLGTMAAQAIRAELLARGANLTPETLDLIVGLVEFSMPMIIAVLAAWVAAMGVKDEEPPLDATSTKNNQEKQE